MSTEAIRVGARTEALILLPAALLLLVCLSFFTLFSYRAVIEQALASRGQEADRLAQAVASRLRPETTTTAEALRRLAPRARAVALLSSSGAPFVVTGDLAIPAAPVDGFAARDLTWWVVPSASLVNVVSGSAVVAGPGRAARVRIDLPALVLRSKARSLRVLWPLVLGTNLALVALLLLYLRRWLVPFDRLVARARQALPGEPEADEVQLLLGTFDRALAVLEERPEADPSLESDDLGAFQRALSRSLESGVLLCDHQGAVLALNEIGAQLLGVAPQTAGGQPLAEVLANHSGLCDLLMDAMRHQTVVHRQEHSVEVEGDTKTLGLTVHPLRRDDGAVRGYLTLFADLTVVQRKAQQRRLAENLAQVGTLAAGVAHEMRNGLATLRGYLGLIERGPDDDTLKNYVHEMRREGDHLQRVLDDFLRFARPGSLRKEAVDLVALARRCAGDPGLEGVGVEVCCGVGVSEAAPAILDADPRLLEQAVRNLLRNAADAQAEVQVTTALTVEIEAGPADMMLFVDDRGPGLAPEVAANPFDPFVTGRAGGVGLGLALARRIVVLHGGALELTPRQHGGMRAAIRLPSQPVT